MKTMNKRPIGLTLLFILAVSALTACGYTLVREKGIYGGDIMAIDVPIFKNLSFEPQISQFFTESFTRELVTTGLFDVNRHNADSTVQGTIRQVVVSPYALGGTGIQVQKSISVSIDIVMTKGSVGFKKSWTISDYEPYNVDDINLEDFNRRDALRRVSARMARRFTSLVLAYY